MTEPERIEVRREALQDAVAFLRREAVTQLGREEFYASTLLGRLADGLECNIPRSTPTPSPRRAP